MSSEGTTHLRALRRSLRGKDHGDAVLFGLLRKASLQTAEAKGAHRSERGGNMANDPPTDGRHSGEGLFERGGCLRPVRGESLDCVATV